MIAVTLNDAVKVQNAWTTSLGCQKYTDVYGKRNPTLVFFLKPFNHTEVALVAMVVNSIQQDYLCCNPASSVVEQMCTLYGINV